MELSWPGKGAAIFWRYLKTWLILDVTLVSLDFFNMGYIGPDFEGMKLVSGILYIHRHIYHIFFYIYIYIYIYVYILTIVV